MEPPQYGPYEPRPWTPPPAFLEPPAPPPSRARLHGLLLACTAFTLAYAGGWWEGVLDPRTFIDFFRPSTILAALEAGYPYALFVVLILGAHEMGHYLACRRYGIPATLPFFLPGIPPIGSFGAVIRIRGAIPNRRALFDVAAAGPLAGFVVALPVLLYGVATAEPVTRASEGAAGLAFGEPLGLMLLQGVLRPEPAIEVNALIGAGWVGMLVTSLNLFPVGQLDGGHAAYAISRRLHRGLSYFTLLCVLLLMAFHMWVLQQPPAYLVWFAILLWMRDRHPRLRDETTPLGPGRIVLAVLLVLVFLFAVIPVPISVSGP